MTYFVMDDVSRCLLLWNIVLNNGSLFPTGLDVTEIPIYFLNEQHITGDISFALRQYLYMTRDIRFLNESGIKVVQEIAEFWASRVFLNSSTNMYEIHGRLTNSSAHTCELNEVKLLFSNDKPKTILNATCRFNVPSRIFRIME